MYSVQNITVWFSTAVKISRETYIELYLYLCNLLLIRLVETTHNYITIKTLQILAEHNRGQKSVAKNNFITF
jgi:hypothetical protein